MTVYTLLNRNVKAWWYHAQLRKQGNPTEARKRERASLRSSVSSLRNCLKNGGSLILTPRGGYDWNLEVGIEHENTTPTSTVTSHVLGYGDYMIDVAKLLGIPIKTQ